VRYGSAVSTVVQDTWRSCKLLEVEGPEGASPLMIAAFTNMSPGRKKMMNAATVPPIRCRTVPKSVTW
jgi:hypothetical protein